MPLISVELITICSVYDALYAFPQHGRAWRTLEGAGHSCERDYIHGIDTHREHG